MLGYPEESQHKPKGVLTARVDETEGTWRGPVAGSWGTQERGNCSDSIKSRRRCHELTGEMIPRKGKLSVSQLRTSTMSQRATPGQVSTVPHK